MTLEQILAAERAHEQAVQQIKSKIDSLEAEKKQIQKDITTAQETNDATALVEKASRIRTLNVEREAAKESLELIESVPAVSDADLIAAANSIAEANRSAVGKANKDVQVAQIAVINAMQKACKVRHDGYKTWREIVKRISTANTAQQNNYNALGVDEYPRLTNTAGLRQFLAPVIDDKRRIIVDAIVAESTGFLSEYFD